MSCTVLALPYALAWIVGNLVIAGVAESKNKIVQNVKQSETIPCDEVQIISEKHFIEKSFETPFMDKALLIKTLEEHGANGINETDFGQIKCFCDHYELIFERTNANNPYYVRIKALDTDDTESKLNDLNSEYAVNVQEASYNSIVSKLEENNLEIENEEVCDDNTIVLTVNLE